MIRLIRQVSAGDFAKIILAIITTLSLVYFAGVQSHRLEVVETNQHRVLIKLEELVRSDYEMKIEIGKLQEHMLEKKTGYTLMGGDR